MSDQRSMIATAPLRGASTAAKASRSAASGTAGWAVLERLPAGAERRPSEAERWRARQMELGAAPLRVSATRPASPAKRGRTTTEECGDLLDADLDAPTRVMPAPSEGRAAEVTTGLRGAIVSLPLTDTYAEEPTTAELPSAATEASNGTDPESTRCCPVLTEAAPPPLPRGPLSDDAVARGPAPFLPRAATPLPRAAIPPTDAEPLRERAITLMTTLKAASPAQKALLLLLPVACGALGALGASRLGASGGEAAPRSPAPLEAATRQADAPTERVDPVAPTPARPLPREPLDAGPAAPRPPSGPAGTDRATEPDSAPHARASQVPARERSSTEPAASTLRRASTPPRSRPAQAPITLARQAVDALVAGSRDEAERLYRALAASNPEDRALATAAEVLRATPVGD